MRCRGDGSRSVPKRGDLGLDDSRFFDDELSLFLLGVVIADGSTGTIVVGVVTGDGSGVCACDCVASFTDLRGVDILVSVGLAQFVHMICWFRDR